MEIKIGRDTSTIAKGLFACFVVIFHMYYTPLFAGESRVPYILCRIGMFGFLFLSGYGCNCSYKEKGLSNFWEKKIETIYIPAVFANIIGAVLAFLLGETMDRETLFENVVRFSPDSIFNMFLWYLHYLFFWYLCFWIVNRFVHSNWKFIIWFIIMLVMWFIGPEMYVWSQANNYCFAFVTGIFYQEMTEFTSVREWFSGVKILKFVIGLLALGGISLAIQMDPLNVTIMGNTISFWIHTALYNAICFCGMMFIFTICREIEKMEMKSIFLWIGKISFMIYVLHNPLMYFPLEKFGEQNRFFVAGIGFCLCLFIGTIYVYKIQPWLLRKSR